jgi:lactoylglutathione lyase/glyoxylase I family protein
MPPYVYRISEPPRSGSFVVEIIGGDVQVVKAKYNDLEESLGVAGYHHLCLNVNDVEETINELRRRGVTIVKEPFEVEAIGRRLAFFSDPWGNLIELAQIL